MIMLGLCDKCLHHETCHLRISATLLDRENIFNAEANVVHCKGFKDRGRDAAGKKQVIVP